MDFSDSPEDAAFRAQARAWLDANVPRPFESDLRHSTWARVALKDADLVAASKDWQRRKAQAGWACLHWPRAWGGRDATPMQRLIWEQEEGVFSNLSFIFTIGHGMCGPTLLAYANEDQKRRYLPALASGEEIWCQLFSEPSAGSDLAGLRMRAQREGEEWVLNGQKIWTSGAHFSDFGIILTRTDPAIAKHRGLTMFFVDMRSPGIEVVPIRQANGDFEFNEVFFTEVRVPDSQRLGSVGEGWRVALTTLMNERLSVGTQMPTGFPELFDFCCRSEAGGSAPVADRAVRSRLAAWAVRDSGLKYTAFRSISALANGATPGPENSISKLVAATMMQEISAYAVELQGAAGVLVDPPDAPREGQFQAMLLRSPASRVEGGTDQILRNIIAERVLGLPADVRVDKDVPFNQIPTGH